MAQREPVVIDEKLLVQAADDRDNDGDITHFQSITLSFKNILKIDNLQLLKNLRTLRLDNNSINKIEGLDYCTNLQWLGGCACSSAARCDAGD